MRAIACLLMLTLGIQWVLPVALAETRADAHVGVASVPAEFWDCLQQRYPGAEFRPLAAHAVEPTLARLRASGYRVREMPSIPRAAFGADADAKFPCEAVLLATADGAAAIPSESTPGRENGRVDTAEDEQEASETGSDSPDDPQAGETPAADAAGAAEAQAPQAAGESVERPADAEERPSRSVFRNDAEPEHIPGDGPQGREARGAGGDPMRATGEMFRGCGDECAAVVFVVLAAVVIWFVVVAAGQIAYDLATDGEIPEFIGGVDARYAWVREDDSGEEKDENGDPVRDVQDEANLFAIRGLVAARSRSDVEVGVAGEFGNLQGRFGVDGRDTAESIDTDYWAVGPVALFPMGGLPEGRLAVDLLVGKGSEPEVENLALARADFLFPLGRRPTVHLGFGIGALYLALSDSAGLARDEGNFNLLYSLMIGGMF